MPILTVYHNTPTEELIRSLEDKRCYSPIIEELCQRLENGDCVDSHDVQTRAQCPVCEAELNVEDEDNGYNITPVE